MYQTTTVEVPGIGAVVVETEDFLQQGYEMCGFESVTTLPDGRSWGLGAEVGDTPAEMHEHCCQAEEILAGVNHLDELDA